MAEDRSARAAVPASVTGPVATALGLDPDRVWLSAEGAEELTGTTGRTLGRYASMATRPTKSGQPRANPCPRAVIGTDGRSWWERDALQAWADRRPLKGERVDLIGLTPEQRRERWHSDRLKRFERQVDPDGTMDPQARRATAESARAKHLADLKCQRAATREASA